MMLKVNRKIKTALNLPSKIRAMESKLGELENRDLGAHLLH